MGVRELLDKFNKKDKLFKEMQNDDRARIKLEQRKLSSEERALNKILEQQRQDRIKSQLRNFHKKEQHDFYHKDVITQPNIFKNSGNQIMKQKLLFRGHHG